jgi:hypothetical protein
MIEPQSSDGPRGPGRAERRVARALAAISLAVGGGVLLAWLLRPWLDLDLPALWPMKANTALCAAASALATLLLVDERPGAAARLRRALGALVVALTLATALEYATGWTSGLDQLLAADPTGDLPGRMSPWTAATFALLATVIAFHGSRLDVVADAALIGSGVVLQLVWAGYLYGVVRLYGVDPRTLTSPQTLLCASLLGVALVLGRLGRGHLSIATRRTTAGTMVRVLMPVAWILPLAIGWLRLFAEGEGLILSTQMGVAIFAVAQTVVLTGLIYGFAYWADALERRYATERARREELERVVAICAWTGRVRWNGEWVRIEKFLAQRFGIQVTHTISEEALERLAEEVDPEEPPP